MNASRESGFMSKKPNPEKGLSKEDRALWEAVGKTVRPYKKGGKKPPVAKAGTARPQPAIGKPKPVLPPAAVATRKAPLYGGHTQEKLRKGKFAPEATLDLHGMTQDRAHSALTRFIASARRTDKRTLLIITGKGALKDGGGVLRKMLPLWLESAPFAGHVLAITAARPEHGGGGAFYVRLRK